MTLALGVDLTPGIDLQVGELAQNDIRAPACADVHERPPDAAGPRRGTAGARTPSTTSRPSGRSRSPASSSMPSPGRVAVLDTAFSPETSAEDRQALLDTAVPSLSDDARTILLALDPERWAPVRTEAARVLDVTERSELRDTETAEARAAPFGPDGRRPLERRAGARGRAHRAARRGQQLVLGAAHPAGAGPAGRRRAAGRGEHPPGRGHRPRRHEGHRARPRPAPRPRPRRPAGGPRRVRRLAPPVRADGRAADRVAADVPAVVLAPEQRRAPGLAAHHDLDRRAAADGGTRGPAVHPAGRRDRAARRRPPRRRDRDHRHGHRRGRRRAR